MDRQFDTRRPQSTSWTTITPSTPTFNPTKFTPATAQTTWKPSFPVPAKSENQESNVILGSVQQDPSGGFVHTFGASKKPSTPQTASPNHSDNAPWQNYNSSAPSRQESVNSAPSPRYVQEIIVPTSPPSQQSRSPIRQNSYQSNPSQFSPVQQTSQRSSPGVYFQPQNSAYDNRANGSPAPVYQTVRQTSTPQQVIRQDSVPYQTSRQESVPYQTQRQDSSAYPNTWNGPSSVQVSPPYQTSGQNSWNQPVQHYPSNQESWPNQLNQQNSYQPSRQDSWSNNSMGPTSPPYQTNRPESISSPPSRPQSVPYQPPSPSVAPGLFSKQNSASPSSPTSVRYDPVVPSSTPGLQRQSSIQYQQSPRPFSPTDYSPVQLESNAPVTVNSPHSYGVPGPFARQQSASGSQPWSPGPVESFPTPPPFSPSSEAAGTSWPGPSDLPSPPPPPPPPPAPVAQAAPVIAPPPPPPPPPPPMPSSAGMNQEVPAWKKQIQATKEAKAAAGIVQTPSTPGQELPAALINSMKRDKKPFTYLPGGIDLSEIRSPKMQRRIIANQQYAPPPPSQMGHQVALQPRQQNGNCGPQQVQNQMERLNLAEGQHPNDRMAAVDAQRRSSTDSSSGYPGQSRSFRILQMMTGGDDSTDSVECQPSPVKRNEEEEMRFTGIRRPDNPIPSRAFQALQKMTQGAEESPNQQGGDPRYCNEGEEEVRQEDGPVDIRYKGGYIPGRSFKMLQEMTGGGPVVPSVLQEKRQQRKPNLHLNINQQPQSPVPKQFPQPSVPASQQSVEEAPKMYRGGRIPSQSFKILQAMTGEGGDSQGEDGTDM